MCLLFHLAEFCGVLSTKISTVIREVCLEVCVSALDLNLSPQPAAELEPRARGSMKQNF